MKAARDCSVFARVDVVRMDRRFKAGDEVPPEYEGLVETVPEPAKKPAKKAAAKKAK